MRLIAFTPLVLCAAALHAQDYTWPRQIPISGGAVGTIVLYQPQAEKLVGNEEAEYLLRGGPTAILEGAVES